MPAGCCNETSQSCDDCPVQNTLGIAHLGRKPTKETKLLQRLVGGAPWCFTFVVSPRCRQVGVLTQQLQLLLYVRVLVYIRQSCGSLLARVAVTGDKVSNQP